MKTFTKKELIEELKRIREKRWIKNARPGNQGGIGNTLEDLLGIEENNLPIPNASEWELKCQRLTRPSLTTLFHAEPSPRGLKIVPRILLPKYGWQHQKAGSEYPENEMSFRQTISGAKRTDRGFAVLVNWEERKVEISFDFSLVDERHKKWLKSVKKRIGLDELNPKPYWGFEDLYHKAGTKLLNCFYVKVDLKKEEGAEFYHYKEVFILEKFDQEKFIKAIESGTIAVDFDAAGMVAAIKASRGTALSNKMVIAYIDIGEAEDWRYYWESWWEPPTATEPGVPDFMVTLDPGDWEGCYPVAFWDTRWQDIMVNDDSSMLKKAISDGFDGIYMDWVEAFEDEHVLDRADDDGVDAAEEMIAFIAMIRDTARHYNPNFVVIAQNATELCEGHPEYFDVIDGIGQEDLSFYGESDVPWGDPDGGDIGQSPGDQAYLVTMLNKYLAEGLPVFTIDYALIPANIDESYSFSNSKGYVPFVSQTSLSRLPSYTPPGYVDIEEQKNLPDEIGLEVYPNPFNSACRIRIGECGMGNGEFQNPNSKIQNVEIFDINGKTVQRFNGLTVANMPVGAGLVSAQPQGDHKDRPYEIMWSPDKSLGSGIYLIRAKIGEKQTIKRVVYLR